MVTSFSVDLLSDISVNELVYYKKKLFNFFNIDNGDLLLLTLQFLLLMFRLKPLVMPIW